MLSRAAWFAQVHRGADVVNGKQIGRFVAFNVYGRRVNNADGSFDAYARTQFTALVRYAFLLTRDRALAEDLVQEALLSAYRKWERIERMDNPDAYVRKAVMRRFLSWRRLRSTNESPTGLIPDTATGQPDASQALSDRDAMIGLLATLPKRQRAVMVLRYYEDMPDDQIADLVGISASTVRVHAARAIAKLREVAQTPSPQTGSSRG